MAVEFKNSQSMGRVSPGMQSVILENASQVLQRPHSEPASLPVSPRVKPFFPGCGSLLGLLDKLPRLGGLNSRNVFPRCPGHCKSEMKVWAGLPSLESFQLSLAGSPLSVPSRGLLAVCVCVLIFFTKIPVTVLGPPIGPRCVLLL